MVAPMALPSMSLAPSSSAAGLACNAHRPRLPNHDDPDLSGVLQLALDFARDLVGEPRRRGIVHRLRGYHDAHFAPRLDRENLFDAFELRGQRLELRESFDVRLERLAPRAGPRPRDRVRRLDDHADGGFVRHVVVMRGDAVDDRGILAVLRRDLDPELHVRAVVLMS